MRIQNDFYRILIWILPKVSDPTGSVSGSIGLILGTLPVSLADKANLEASTLYSPVSMTKLQYSRYGSGIRCLFDPWIWDPESGLGKKSQDLDPRSRSGMSNPDHIF
jgi:hypothetical protein